MGFRNIIIILVLIVLATTSYAQTISWEAYTPDGRDSVNLIGSGNGNPDLYTIDWGDSLDKNYQLKIINKDYVGDSSRECVWPQSCSGDYKYIWYTIADHQCLYLDSIPKGFACCGDFPNNDTGVITQPNGEYLCSPYDQNRNWDPTGVPTWIRAYEEPFRVYPIDRSNPDKFTNPVKYDVISNKDKWVACKPGATLTPISYDINVSSQLNEELDKPPLGVGTGGIGDNDVTPSIGDTTPGSVEGTEEGIVDFGGFCSDCQTIGADTTGEDADGDGYPDDINGDGDSDDANEDCDDENPNRNPGEMEHPDDGIDQNCDGLDNSPDEQFPTNLADITDANELAARFVCYQEDDAGRWAECVGYDLSTALNPPRARRVGNIMTTLREFDKGCSTHQNCVFLLKLVKDYTGLIYHLPFDTQSGDAKITGWTQYKSLSFFIFFSNNYVMDMEFYKLKPGYEDTNPERFTENHFDLIDKIPIIEYVINGPDLGKWLKVEVPIQANYTDIDRIWFKAEKADVEQAGGETIIGSKSYANIIGIDKIHLVPFEGPKYCSAEKYDETKEYTNFWISDLDVDVTGGYGNQIGKYACEGIPSYGWTGTKCCGDENNEYYNDTLHGCWAGNRVIDGTRIMTLSYGKNALLSYEICSKESCEYYLQGDTSTIEYTNPYPNLYDLNFFESGSTGKSLDLTPYSAETSSAMLKAQNIPLQILYLNKSFWGCMAVPYIINLAVDDEGNSIIQNIGPEDVCTVKGKYFCSHDRKWSDESIGDIPASQRTNKKNGHPNVNMILNSGFESVNAGLDAVPNFNCNVVAGKCVDSTGILSLAAPTNSHAAVYSDDPNYGYSLCCKFTDGASLTTTNDGSGALFTSLIASTNSHVAADMSGAVKIGLKSDEYVLSCHTGYCNMGEECLGSVLSTSNSHFTQCNQGAPGMNICCVITARLES